MTGIQALIAISAVFIAIVTYSALVVSSKQEQRMVQRERIDNNSSQHPYSSPSGSFSFETSEEFEPEKDDDYDQL